MKIKRGSTSVRRLIFIGDSTSTTGAGLTGLVYNSSGLAAYYFAGDLSNEVQITLASATLGSYTSGGFVEVDATNMPGWYEVGIPDAAMDGGNEVAIQYRGATNMVPVNIYIELDAVDYQTAAFGANTTTPLDADGIRTAVGLASANLDTQLGTIDTVADDTYFAVLDVQSRIPAALVSGRIDASVGAMAANTLTASALASDATAEIGDAFLSHVITKGSPGTIERAFWQVTKAAASFDGTVQTSGSNTASSFLTDIAIDDFAGQVIMLVDGALAGEARAITSVVSGVVTVHDAFTGVPADGVNFLVLPQQVYSIPQIQSGLATSAEAAAIQSVVDAIELDTQNIQSRLPAALIGGRMDSNASNLEDIATGSQSPTVERSVSDDQAINFTWPATGATITGNVSIDNGTLTPITGTISFLRTESTGKNIYSISYNAADRPSSEGQARYILTDGTYTRSFSVRISDSANQVISGGDIDGYSLEEAMKIMLAALAGKVTGGGTTSITFRAADDSKDRITATVTSAGNRTSITLDADG